MRMKLLIICSLLAYTNSENIDESFKKMCDFWGGGAKWKARDQGKTQPMQGDTCPFKFPIAFADPESSWKYCENNVPYHINSVKQESKSLICEAEATLICKDGWVQMFGRCYKITKIMMHRPDAEAECKKEGGSVAFMHREALPFRINDYFTNVSRVWMDASEAITEGLIYNVQGGYLLLALDGYKYSLPNIALARVAVSEKAMALCEYTPKMNQAESNYLLRRYGEIYYPTIFTSDSAYVRTASSSQRYEDRKRDSKYCQNVLRPFLQTNNAWAAVPTKEFLEILGKTREPTIIRTSVYSGDSSKSNRINKACSASNARYYGLDYSNGNDGLFFKTFTDEKIWRPDEPKEECDGGSWSTGIVLSREKDIGLEAMSDARYAPIYCQTNFEVMDYGSCDARFTPYVRKRNGQKWCHMVSNKRQTYESAEKLCQSYGGAHLTGFEDEDEMNFLDGMLNKVNYPGQDVNFWLGAYRRKQCEAMDLKNKGFVKDPTAPCSRDRIFEWNNGVAQNPPQFLKHWMTESEPNFMEADEKCVELMKDKQGRWGGIDGTKKLNDIPCDRKIYSICGKEAPIQVKTSK